IDNVLVPGLVNPDGQLGQLKLAEDQKEPLAPEEPEGRLALKDKDKDKDIGLGLEQPRKEPPGFGGGINGKMAKKKDVRFDRYREIAGEWLEAEGKRRVDLLAELAKLDPARAAQLLEVTYQPWVVREYAHKHQARPDGIRADFTDTVCW